MERYFQSIERFDPLLASSMTMLMVLQLIPTAAERLVWGRGAGDGLDVVKTEYGKIGGLIW